MATLSTSLSIRPWHFEHQEQTPVIELLDRVNRERGHFRDILDASLQEEVATVGALQLADSDDDPEEDAVADEEGGIIHPTTREELYRAKFEMIQKVSMAHNEVMMALDFVSLLESKDSAAGKQTMSQFLKENVPAGTLGTDVWQRMPKDTEREAQDERLAYSVRLNALQKSADSILSAAKTLEDNVRKETRYWNEILSVTEAGWNVCRLPGQRHKLAVRFGLSEGSPEFSRGGIAALTADEDGAVSLDRGLGSKTRSVRVTIRQDQRIIGSSTSAAFAGEADEVLESRIKLARDALFDEELFREVEREARQMVSLGVESRGNTIAFPSAIDDSPLTIEFELVSRNEAALAQHASSSSLDSLAHAVLCTAKLLLCQAHRDQLKRRSAMPAPLNDARTERPMLQVLRPLLTLSAHHQCVHAMNIHLESLAGVLQDAGIQTQVHRALLHAALPDDVQSTEALLSTLLTGITSEATIQLTTASGTLVTIRIETSALPGPSTTISFISSNSRLLQATNIRQAIWQLDRILAHVVAEALAATTDHSWYTDEDDAHLYREDAAVVSGIDEAEVVLDGHSKTLTLISPSSQKHWSPVKEAGQDIWQAWKEIT